MQGEEQLLAVALDVGGRAGMVGGHDFEEGRAEFAPRPREFAVEPDRVGPPAAGDLADREVLLEAEFQEGDPPAGASSACRPRASRRSRASPMSARAHARSTSREGGSIAETNPPGREGAGVLRGRVGERERAAAALDATGDVPDDADQERAEGRDAIVPGPGEHAAGAEALDEDVLDGVVDLDDPGDPRQRAASRARTNGS